MERAEEYSRYYLIPWPESQDYIIGYDLCEDGLVDNFDVVLGPQMSVLVTEEIFNKEIINNGSGTKD